MNESFSKIESILHYAIWNDEGLSAHVCHVLNRVQLTICVHYLLLLWSTHIIVIFLLELNGLWYGASIGHLDCLLRLLVLNLGVHRDVLLLAMQQEGLQRGLLTI